MACTGRVTAPSVRANTDRVATAGGATRIAIVGTSGPGSAGRNASRMSSRPVMTPQKNTPTPRAGQDSQPTPTSCVATEATRAAATVGSR